MASIKSRESTIVQIPAQGNKFLAVCQVKITTQLGQIFTATGSCQPENDIDISGILETAEDIAYNRAIIYAENDSYSQPANNPVPQNNIPVNSLNAGGGDKPASQKQMDYLKKLCEMNARDLQEFITEECGVDQSLLQGRQADMLIKKLAA